LRCGASFIYQGHATRRIQVLALRPGSVVAIVMITLPHQRQQGAHADSISLEDGAHHDVLRTLQQQMGNMMSPLRQGHVTHSLKAIATRALLPGSQEHSVGLNDAVALPHRWMNLLRSSQSSSDHEETEEEGQEEGDEETSPREGALHLQQHAAKVQIPAHERRGEGKGCGQVKQDQDGPHHGWQLSLDQDQPEEAGVTRLKEMLDQVQEHAAASTAALAGAEKAAMASEQRVSEWQRANTARVAQVDALQQELREHTSQVPLVPLQHEQPQEKDLAQELAQARAEEVVFLRKQLQERENQNAEWQAKVVSLEEAIRSMHDEAAALREQVTVAERARATNERQRVEREELSALHLEIRQSAEREKQAAELVQQQKQLELHKAQILQAQRDELQKDVDQARHALAERDKQLANLTADSSQQVEVLRDKDMALATLQREAKDREDTLLAAQEQVMRLTAEHKEQMARIVALQQRVEDKDDSLPSFRQVVEDKELVMKSTRAEVAALAGLKGEHEESIRLLRQDVESKDAALNAMRKQVEQVEKALTIAKQALDEDQKQAQKAQAQLLENRKQLDYFETQVAQLKAENEAAGGSKDAELEEAHVRLEAAQGKLQATTAALQQAGDHVHLLEREVEEGQRQVMQAQAEAYEVRLRCAAVQQQLLEREKELQLCRSPSPGERLGTPRRPGSWGGVWAGATPSHSNPVNPRAPQDAEQGSAPFSCAPAPMPARASADREAMPLQASKGPMPLRARKGPGLPVNPRAPQDAEQPSAALAQQAWSQAVHEMQTVLNRVLDALPPPPDFSQGDLSISRANSVDDAAAKGESPTARQRAQRDGWLALLRVSQEVEELTGSGRRALPPAMRGTEGSQELWATLILVASAVELVLQELAAGGGRAGADAPDSSRPVSNGSARAQGHSSRLFSASKAGTPPAKGSPLHLHHLAHSPPSVPSMSGGRTGAAGTITVGEEFYGDVRQAFNASNTLVEVVLRRISSRLAGQEERLRHLDEATSICKLAAVRRAARCPTSPVHDLNEHEQSQAQTNWMRLHPPARNAHFLARAHGPRTAEGALGGGEGGAGEAGESVFGSEGRRGSVRRNAMVHELAEVMSERDAALEAAQQAKRACDAWHSRYQAASGDLAFAQVLSLSLCLPLSLFVCLCMYGGQVPQHA
jgi:hypothetical protein